MSLTEKRRANRRRGKCSCGRSRSPGFQQCELCIARKDRQKLKKNAEKGIVPDNLKWALAYGINPF